MATRYSWWDKKQVFFTDTGFAFFLSRFLSRFAWGSEKIKLLYYDILIVFQQLIIKIIYIIVNFLFSALSGYSYIYYSYIYNGQYNGYIYIYKNRI